MNFSNEERSTLSTTPNPVIVLIMLLLACMIGVLVGGGLAYGWVAAQGLDFQNIILHLNEQSPLIHRNAVRMANLLNHIFSFTLPAVLVAFLVYRRQWIGFLKLDRFPDVKILGTSLFFVLAAFPFIQIIIWLNQQIPFPSWLQTAGEATDSMVKGLLVMNTPGEFLFNMLIIAVLPAIGEELVFRGMLQQHLEKIVRPSVLSVWITAFLFGAVHMQAERFLALSVLGAALGYTFYWSRNLWIPILGHFFINGLQVAGQYITNGKLTEKNTVSLEMQDWIMGVISLLITLSVGYYLWLNREDQKNPTPEPLIP